MLLSQRVPEDKLLHCADMLKCIAHPARMSIIDLLALKGPMSVTEIFTQLELRQAAASHHLSILRRNGLLEYKKKGKKMIYSLTMPELIKIIQCIEKCAV